MCSRHLYGADRMLTAWPADDEVIALDLTVAMGPLRRRRIVDDRLADAAMRTPPVVQPRPPEA